MEATMQLFLVALGLSVISQAVSASIKIYRLVYGTDQNVRGVAAISSLTEVVGFIGSAGLFVLVVTNPSVFANINCLFR